MYTIIIILVYFHFAIRYFVQQALTKEVVLNEYYFKLMKIRSYSNGFDALCSSLYVKLGEKIIVHFPGKSSHYIIVTFNFQSKYVVPGFFVFLQNFCLV